MIETTGVFVTIVLLFGFLFLWMVTSLQEIRRDAISRDAQTRLHCAERRHKALTIIRKTLTLTANRLDALEGPQEPSA